MVLLCVIFPPESFAATEKQLKAERALWGEKHTAADSVRPEAIKQGSRGDCWFLSALALAAQEEPETIPKMITVQADGTYKVKFPGADEITEVVAEDLKQNRKIGVRPTQYGDWPLVLECAVAKIRPENIDDGGSMEEGIKLVMGIDTQTFSFITNRPYPTISTQELHDTLMAAYQAHQPIVLGTARKSYIVESHAYSVMEVTKATSGRSARVIIRNPWGRMGFARRNVFEIEPLEDGKFSVPISSLFKYFGEVTVPDSAVRLYRTSVPQVQRPRRVSYVPRVSSLTRNGGLSVSGWLLGAIFFTCLVLANRPSRRFVRGAFIVCLAVCYAIPKKRKIS